jgi:hypothetical protein
VASGASTNAFARSAVDFFSFVATANAARGDLFAELFFAGLLSFVPRFFVLLVVMIPSFSCNAH